MKLPTPRFVSIATYLNLLEQFVHLKLKSVVTLDDVTKLAYYRCKDHEAADQIAVVITVHLVCG
jgi:hypothetical protein